MPRRLQKTTADYVAIAISPALIMTLVGSLVFFLIELFYVGEFHARINYVFALFVFAAVLIARIAIEMGTEHAMKFGLALGFAVFAVLAKFVQHPNPFSHLINLGLIGIVWWCAHRLTWDCTLIDEREDASGAGLMQRLGADSPGTNESNESNDDRPDDGRSVDGKRDTGGTRADPTSRDQQRALSTADNELLAADDNSAQGGVQGPHAWWKRWLGRRGPHPPGMWVLYFSMAALPIFGLGQRLIPTAASDRRRYAFALLTVYVASALALLVTTSFLGLRRYLRQRRIEMPAPIAATWVVIGALLIGVVLLVAALLPRPNAEYAVSQVPWQVRSPEGLAPSRWSFGTDGTGDNGPEENAVSRAGESQQTGHAVTNDQADENQATRDGGQEPRQSGQTDTPEDDFRRSPQDQHSQDQRSKGQDAKGQAHNNETASSETAKPRSENNQPIKPSHSQREFDPQTAENRSSGTPPPPAASRSMPPNPLAYLSLPGAGIGAILKLLFYAVIALIIGTLVWKNRRQLMAALIDLMGQLRALLARLLGSRSPTGDGAADKPDVASKVAPPTFAQFQDPFLTGRSLAPEQLVRYTFEAFEAWARDQGIARRVDQTPHELVRLAAPPQTTLSHEAQRMVRLYNSLAYAGVKVPSEQAARLQTLWALMRKTGEGKGGRDG